MGISVEWTGTISPATTRLNNRAAKRKLIRANAQEAIAETTTISAMETLQTRTLLNRPRGNGPAEHFAEVVQGPLLGQGVRR